MNKTLIYNRKLDRAVLVPEAAVAAWTADADWSVAPKSGPKTEHIANAPISADAAAEQQEKKS